MKKIILLLGILLLVAFIFISCEPKDACYYQITTDSISYKFPSEVETPKYLYTSDTTIWCDEIIPPNIYQVFEKDYVLRFTPIEEGTPCIQIHHLNIEFIKKTL
jgi:hypothetical protein